MEGSRTPVDHFTIRPVKQRTRYSIKYNIPDSWALLLEKLKDVKTFINNVGDGEDVPILSMIMKKRFIQDWINNGRNEDVLRTLFNKKNTCKIRVRMKTDTAKTYEEFKRTPITQFCILDNHLYTYRYWNPFCGRKNPIGNNVTIGDYPAIILLMYRINMVLHLLAMLQVYIEKINKRTTNDNRENNEEMTGLNDVNDNNDDFMMTDENIEEKIDKINGVFLNIDATKFKSNGDFKKFFIIKDLKNYISAHVTAMCLIEQHIEDLERDENNKPKMLLYVFQQAVFFDNVLPKNIKYEYSPFNDKYVTVHRKEHVDVPHKLFATELMDKNNIGNEKILFCFSYKDLIKMDLDELSNHIKKRMDPSFQNKKMVDEDEDEDEDVIIMKPSNIAKHIALFCTHFFPLTQTMSKAIKNGVDLSFLSKKLSQNNDSFEKMTYINDINDEKIFELWSTMKLFIDNTHYFLYPNIEQCTLFWAWIIKVNVFQKALQMVNNIKKKICKKIYSVIKEQYEQYSWISENEFINIKKKMMNFCGKKETEKEFQQISYRLFIELNNLTPLATAFFYTQRFSDADILGNANTFITKNNFYNEYYPHTDQTLLPSMMPRISRFLCTQHVDRKPKDMNEGTLAYCLSKVRPNKCGIRKIGSMLLKSAKKNFHTRRFLFGVFWCSSTGLYLRSNHYDMSKDFNKLIVARKSLFFDVPLNGKTLDQRRILFIEKQTKTKYVSHDMLREHLINITLENLPVLESYYKAKWKGFPYVNWDAYRISSITNINFLRKFYSETGFIPTGDERCSTSERNKLDSKLKNKKKIKTIKIGFLKNLKSGNASILEKNLDTIIDAMIKLNNIDATTQTLKDGVFIYEKYMNNTILMEMMEQIMNTNTKNENIYIRNVFWSRFLFIKTREMEKSLFQYIVDVYSSVGLGGVYFLIMKALKEKNGNEKGNKRILNQQSISRNNKMKMVDEDEDDDEEKLSIAQNLLKKKLKNEKRDQQSRRTPPLYGCNIYRLFSSSYVQSIKDVLKNLFVEKVVCTALLQKKEYPFPYDLTYEFFDGYIKNKIVNYEHLGKLTLNYMEYYETIFLFLHDECELSLCGMCLLLKTVEKFVEKESMRKIVIGLRALSHEDFRLIDYYFTMDHKKIEIQSIEDRSTDFMKLFSRTAKNRKEWTNTTFVSPDIFLKSNGYDSTKIKKTNCPMNHQVLTTRCCKRITTSPFFVGFGNVKVVRKDEIDDLSIFDESVNRMLCTCHLFHYNSLQCCIHSTRLAQPGYNACCMFSKNDNKKKKKRIKKLIREYKDILSKRNDISDDDPSINASKRTINEIIERTHKSLKEMGFKDINLVENNSEFFKRFEQMVQDDEIVVDGSNSYVINDKVLKEFEDDSVIGDIIENEENAFCNDIDGQKNNQHKRMVDENDDEEDIPKEKPKNTKNLIKEVLQVIQKKNKYVSFGDINGSDSSSTATSSSKNKEITEQNQGKIRKRRKTDSLFKTNVGKQLINDIRKWSGRIHKYATKSYFCNNKEQRKVKKIPIFGRILACLSTNEHQQFYRFCTFCGSYVRQHLILFYGKEYMCEHCWAYRPEGCFYFCDNITDKFVIVNIDESIKLCMEITMDLSVREKKLQTKQLNEIINRNLYRTERDDIIEEEEERVKNDKENGIYKEKSQVLNGLTPVRIDDNNGETSIQKLMFQWIYERDKKRSKYVDLKAKNRKKLIRIPMVNLKKLKKDIKKVDDLKKRESNVREAYKDLDASNSKRNQKPKKTAAIIKTTRMFVEEIKKMKMKQICVFDDINGKEDGTKIKMIQTHRKNWLYSNYFGNSDHVFIFSRIIKYNDKKKQMKAYRSSKFRSLRQNTS